MPRATRLFSEARRGSITDPTGSGCLPHLQPLPANILLYSLQFLNKVSQSSFKILRMGYFMRYDMDANDGTSLKRTKNAEEMAQRPGAVLTQDCRAAPVTHIRKLTTSCKTSFRGSTSLPASMDNCSHVWIDSPPHTHLLHTQDPCRHPQDWLQENINSKCWWRYLGRGTPGGHS